MLERSFRNPPLLFVTEIVQDKARKPMGLRPARGALKSYLFTVFMAVTMSRPMEASIWATRQKLSVVKIDIETCRAGLDFDIEE